MNSTQQPNRESMMMLNELPGAELILPGLEDIHSGKTNTVGALLIEIAATRLITAGLDFPRDRLNPEPEITLYTQLQAEQDDAYLYYNALLNRLNSFCNALELISTPTFPDPDKIKQTLFISYSNPK